jgi:hypothetical protein
LPDHLFLNRWQVAKLQLDSEVTTRNHHRVGDLEDLAEVANRFQLLELGDHGCSASQVAKMLLAQQDVFRVANEGQGDPVDLQLDRELQVFQVFLGQRRHWQRAPWHADSLPLAQQAASHHRAFGPSAVDAAHHQLDPAVVQQNPVALAQRLDELRVADLNLGFILPRLAGQEDDAAAHEALEGGLERTGADLRPLQIAQQGDRPIACLGGFANVGCDLAVGVVVAVREVHPRDVHARLDHRAEHRRR